MGSERAATDREHRSEREMWLEKLQFLSDAMESTSQPFGVGSPGGGMMLFNDAFCRLTGYTRDELYKIDWARDLTPPEFFEQENRALEKLERTRLPQQYDKGYRRKDGTIVPVELLVHAALDSQGKTLFYYSFITDISERRKNEEKLRKSCERLESTVIERTAALARSEAQLRSIIETSPVPMVVFDESRNHFINKKFSELFGYTIRDIPSVNEWWPLAYPDREYRESVKKRWYTAIDEAVRDRTSIEPQEASVTCKDGSRKHVLCYFSSIGDLNLSVFYDITERKWIENEQELMVEFLRLANCGKSTKSLVNAAMAFFREQSGCEAVGIRLREGDDYPYYETRGFPPEFAMAESHLGQSDEAGMIVRDSSGHPALECICGNVICGRFDPARPSFTPRGSFWTNSTSRLLASMTEADRPSGTCNRCHGEGYESVAVIALRLGDDCLGTLQLNDRRPGCFTPDQIALWERLADYLAVSLAKFRTDEALRASEQRYRSLFENMMNGYAYCRMLYDADGNPEDFVYLDVNRAFAGLTGLKDVVGKRATEAIPGIREQHPEVFEIYGRVARTGTPESFELEFKPIGAWLSLSVYSMEKGYFTVVFDNITRRKQAEEALRASETRFRALIQNSSDIIRIIGRDGLIKYDSPSSTKILGYPPGYTIGKSPLEFIHPDDKEKARKDLGEVVDRRNSGIPTVIRIRSADGSYLDAEATGVNLIGTPGVDGLVMNTRPITERKRAEEDLKKAKDQAELYLDLMGHDINNLHQIAMGYLEFAREMAGPESEQKAYIDKPLEVLRRGARLIDNVRKLQKLREGVYEKGPVDLREVLASALAEYRDLPGKTISAEYHANQNCRIIASELLSDVFTNLIDNAIKHARYEPRVFIRLDRVRVNGLGHYRVAVEDNGPGIPDSKKYTIFNRLLEGDSHSRGMGLGLYMVKSLVESYDGRVWVEDRVAGDHTKGARFVVILPAAGQ